MAISSFCELPFFIFITPEEKPPEGGQSIQTS
jgi:hypothetical protein